MYRLTYELERNPKWITSKLSQKYYGFQDVDIIIGESKLNVLPFFYITKTHKYEMWISDDVLVDDVEKLGRAILNHKLKNKYNLWYPNKSIDELSTLLFMLDGGSVEVKRQQTS
jgi:hypothetical protein